MTIEGFSRVDTSRPHEMSSWTRTAYFIGGNVLPSLGILLVVGGIFNQPRWQTNEFHDILAILIAGSCGLVFCPFLVYSIYCLTLAAFSPQIAVNKFLVPLGIYTGIILALQYCVIVGIVFLHVSGLRTRGAITILVVLIGLTSTAIALAAWGGWNVAGWIIRRARGAPQTRLLLALLTFAFPLAAICLGIALPRETVLSILVVVAIYPILIFVITLIPCWYLLANIAMSVRIIRTRGAFQFRLGNVLVFISWLAAYLAAWRFAVREALDAYSALPTTPPSSSCYIATAAMNGHRIIVRWQEVQGPSGETFRVNMQLAYLKCAEIALKTSVPRLHRTLRWIYDTIGPRLARRLSNVWAADAVYLTLLPLEWIARFVLTLIVRDVHQIARRLYR